HEIHHLLIIENGDVCGVLSDRDIFEKGVMGNGVQINPILRVADVMHRPVASVTDDTEVGDVIKTMREHNISAIPVLCGDKRWAILTETDLLRFLERS